MNFRGKYLSVEFLSITREGDLPLESILEETKQNLYFDKNKITPLS